MRPLARRGASQALCAAAICCLQPILPIANPRPALAAAELSDEQALIVEAWAVIQRGYVDQNFAGLDWKGAQKRGVSTAVFWRRLT